MNTRKTKGAQYEVYQTILHVPSVRTVHSQKSYISNFYKKIRSQHSDHHNNIGLFYPTDTIHNRTNLRFLIQLAESGEKFMSH